MCTCVPRVCVCHTCTCLFACLQACAECPHAPRPPERPGPRRPVGPARRPQEGERQKPAGKSSAWCSLGLSDIFTGKMTPSSWEFCSRARPLPPLPCTLRLLQPAGSSSARRTGREVQGGEACGPGSRHHGEGLGQAPSLSAAASSQQPLGRGGGHSPLGKGRGGPGHKSHSAS